VGEPMRQTAAGRNRVDILIAVVVSGEGERVSVRGKAREHFLSPRRAETGGGAAGFWNHPDVAGVDERNLPGRDRRVATHPRVDGTRDRGRIGGAQVDGAGENEGGSNGARRFHKADDERRLPADVGTDKANPRRGSVSVVAVAETTPFNERRANPGH